jgi:DNA topoisomerase-1
MNIILEVTKKKLQELDGLAKRMKFSTTTTHDLINAYSALQPLDILNFYAGETRHKLDWLWGINFSRALTHALFSKGISTPLSIGRVQGPTLALLAKREIDITEFKPKPYWNVTAVINNVTFANVRGNIIEKEIADKAVSNSEAHMHHATIERVEVKEEHMRPWPPFDLTSLQLEASRVLHIDPSTTLTIAQSLYERSYTSYPRTSSQKLPYTLFLPGIIAQLSKNPDYSEHASMLISQKRFKPAEGSKTDEAHPAIFPTGVMPKNLSEAEARLYEIITRRFLSCFAEYATLAKTKLVAKIGDEAYEANGTRVVSAGWLAFYKYTKVEEVNLPAFRAGAVVSASSIKLNELMTKPPRRFNKASLIAELEKKNLGTKATRAAIIDTLFKRKYIEGTSITVTQFGLTVYRALAKYCSMIIDDKTTAKLEDDMELVAKGRKSEDEVIGEGKRMLLDAIRLFDKNKGQIAEAMKTSFNAVSLLGICPKDGGNLVVRRSRVGKQFVGCSNYPACTNTYSLPQHAKIEPTSRVCDACHTPFIKVIRRGLPVLEMDLDPKCPNRKSTVRVITREEPALAKAQPIAKQVAKKRTKKPTRKKSTKRKKERR